MITLQIAAVLAITIFAFYMFIKEKFSVDAIAISVMIILIVTRLVTPDEGVSGFSNAATITVLCMFILSAGIQKTGIIQKFGDALLKFTKKSLTKQLLAITGVIGPISGFINNTAAVAITLPMIIKLADKTKTYASKLLIPLSFISMAGGTLTLIGTSTNILANDIYKRLGFEGIGLFEFTKLGLIVLGVTSLYFLVIGRFLLPKRRNPPDTSDPHLKLTYNTEVVISPTSPLRNQTVKTNQLKTDYNIDILHITRNKKTFKNIQRSTIKPNDTLLIHGTREDLLKARDKGIIEIKSHMEHPQKSTKTYNLVQFMISGESSLLHRTINSSNFKKRYTAVVLGLKRGNEVIKNRMESIRLKFGDILLIRATELAIEKLKMHKDFIFIGEVPRPFNSDKLWHAVGIVFLVVLLAALRVFPIMVSALIGVFLMVALKVITLEEGYKSVNWEVILLLAGIIPLGIAMEKSGAAAWLAEIIVGLFQNFQPVILLAVLYLVTTILTELISNNAAVIVIIPIAVSVAQQLNLNPLSFVIAVMFAASTSFLTPIGYQTNTMVYSAGNYKFKDFIKVGLPLNLILLFVTVHFISKFWGI